MEKKKVKTKDLTKMAMMGALVFLATYFIKIPSINGYTHLGDCMIFISVLILGWRKGALAGGVGAALADFLGGYMQWVILTFFIKAIMAIIMGLITEKLFPKLRFGWIIGAVTGGIFQVVGYTLVKIPLFGMAYAITELPVLTMQTISGIVLAFIIITSLAESGTIRKLKGI